MTYRKALSDEFTRPVSEAELERTFALNHLAAFTLTNELLDLVTAAPQGRVITVSSEAHSGKLDFANLQGERSYNFLRMYAATKTANILFSFELARRLAGTNATSNAVSPGPTRTRFGDDLTGPPRLFPLVMRNIPFLFKPADVGSRTLVELAASPEYARASGGFCQNGRERRAKPITHDITVARRLWALSEGMIDAVPAAA
jgi:NAD(P)-dependent dehydrogenase (short-subunit alcohol dehydrogenase family)